jgi:hypothetical protein
VKVRLVVLIALAAALVAVPSAALGSSAQSTAGSQNFPDSIGEDANAPDITSVDLSNDDAGLITFKINISNRPALTQDMSIDILLNTDQNTATGDPNLLGSDFAIELTTAGVALFQWNGTDLLFADQQTTLVYSYDATGATIRISASELGKTKGMNFGVIATSGITTDTSGNPDFTNAHDDFAPDAGHGFFSYPVVTKLTLTPVSFTLSPKPARAGKPFSASLAATESDTAGPVTTGTVTCSATIAGKHIAATHRVANGIATCMWRIPKTAKKKTIRGTITLTVQGVALTKSFSSKIVS